MNTEYFKLDIREARIALVYRELLNSLHPRRGGENFVEVKFPAEKLPLPCVLIAEEDTVRGFAS